MPENPSNPNADGPSTNRFEQEAARIPEVIEADAGDGTAATADAQVVGWPEKLIVGMFELPCAYIAGRLGDYWKLTGPEIKALVATAKPVLDQYLPFDLLGPTGALLVTLTVVFGPRLAEVQIKKQKQTQSTATAESVA